jgi:DNA polymerase-3 subunit gamma/tau
VKFLLATTDPQKLPVTVLSRCLQFNLKRLPVATIIARLEHVLDAEKIPWEPAALRLLAVAADGSLRDALSLLDQLLAFGQGEARDADARAMLGTVDRQQVAGLAERLAAQDAPALLEYALGLEQFTPDYAQLLDELNSLFTQVALRQVVPDLPEESSDHPPELLATLAAQIAREDLQLYYQIGVIGRRDLSLAPDPREGFAMTLLRMLAFRPGPGSGIATQASGGPGVITGAATASPAQGLAAARAAVSAAAAAPRAQAPAAAVPASPAAAPELPLSAANWAVIVGRLDLGGLARQLAVNCVFVAREAGVLRLALDQRSQSIRSRTQEDKLAQALSRYLGEPVRIEIELGAGPVDTPAREQLRRADERLASARDSLAADPAVLALQERFDGILMPDSVRLPAMPAVGEPPSPTEGS